MNPMWLNVTLQAILSAINAAIYASNGNPASLAASAFNAGMAVMSLIVVVVEESR